MFALYWWETFCCRSGPTRIDRRLGGIQYRAAGFAEGPSRHATILPMARGQELLRIPETTTISLLDKFILKAMCRCGHSRGAERGARCAVNWVMPSPFSRCARNCATINARAGCRESTSIGCRSIFNGALPSTRAVGYAVSCSPQCLHFRAAAKPLQRRQGTVSSDLYCLLAEGCEAASPRGPAQAQTRATTPSDKGPAEKQIQYEDRYFALMSAIVRDDPR